MIAERFFTRSFRATALTTLVALSGLSVGCGGAQTAAKPTVAAELPPVKNDAKLAFNDGVRLMRLGSKHYGKAQKRFQEALDQDETLFEAWHNIGYIHWEKGRADEAADAFAKALKIQPAARKTLLALGDALTRAGRLDEAKDLYESRLEAEPEDKELRMRYARILRESGQYDEALEEVRVLLRKNSANADAHNALGLIYYKMGKQNLAEAAFKKASELNGESALPWNNLGLSSMRKGKDQEAFAAFQKASELDPKYAQARLNKAVVYMDCGDYKKARAELEKALTVDDTNPDVHVTLGVAARGEGKFDDAKRAYQKALDLDPEHADALYNMALLYMDFKDDLKKAGEYLRRFVEAAPSDHPKKKDAEARLKETGGGEEDKGAKVGSKDGGKNTKTAHASSGGQHDNKDGNKGEDEP